MSTRASASAHRAPPSSVPTDVSKSLVRYFYFSTFHNRNSNCLVFPPLFTNSRVTSSSKYYCFFCLCLSLSFFLFLSHSLSCAAASINGAGDPCDLLQKGNNNQVLNEYRWPSLQQSRRRPLHFLRNSNRLFPFFILVTLSKYFNNCCHVYRTER